jgi:hypothetical protein
MAAVDRKEVLDLALTLITGDRNEAYGDPVEMYNAVAQMWGAYLGSDFTGADVIAMLVLLKVARVRVSPDLADHWVDIAGYSALGAEVSKAQNS